MKKLSFFIILLTILSFILASCQKEPSNPLETTLSGSNTSALAKADTHTENLLTPVETNVFVPCAADGAGEIVHLSGTLHALYHYTIDAKGVVHVKNHTQPQNLTGVGLTTGDKYQGTGVTQDEYNFKVGEEYTYVNNFRMIGQGKAVNYLVHETYHMTINANGEMTAYVDNYTVDCKSVPYLGVTPSSVSLGSSTNSQSAFNISSNTRWSVSDDANWLTVSPTSGSGNGTVTVTATSANTSTSSRSATVTISGSRVSNKTVTVTQSGMSYSCYPNLPNPSLRYTGSEDYSTESGNYTRYNLTVDNFSSFPNELFNAAPDLPPCGLNNNSSRSWVYIYDNNNNYIYGFCGLPSPSDLQGLWFGLPRGQNPPSGVYIIIIDRRCNNEYKSNSVSIY